MHILHVADGSACNREMIFVDLTGVDSGTARPGSLRKKMRGHAEVGSRLNVVLERDSRVDLAECARAHPLPVEVIRFAGDQCPCASDENRRFWVGLGQLYVIEAPHCAALYPQFASALSRRTRYCRLRAFRTRPAHSPGMKATRARIN